MEQILPITRAVPEFIEFYDSLVSEGLSTESMTALEIETLKSFALFLDSKGIRYVSENNVNR